MRIASSHFHTYSTMNARLLVAAVAGVVVGAVADTWLNTNGAREYITLQRGDTITTQFTALTDSVLVVSGTKVIAARCGESRIHLRLLRARAPFEQVSADSIFTRVVGCDSAGTAQPDTVIATLTLYNAFYRDVANDSVFGAWVDTIPQVTFCTYVEAVNAKGETLTGKVFTLESSNPAVARVGSTEPLTSLPPGLSYPTTCPDTTIDPHALRWSTPPTRRVRAAVVT